MAPLAQIAGIQSLRAFAALLVVWVHAREQFGWLPGIVPSFFGAYGVDLFFVISGFIMVVSTHGKRMSPTAFWARRLVRIVPLYWMSTLFLLTVAFAAPQLVKTVTIHWPHVIGSLFFIPVGSPSLHGKMFPLLVPGWSLNYEMAFYLLFGLALLLPPRRRTTAMAIVLVSASVYWWLVRPDGITGFYFNPIILTFAMGMFIGELHLRDALPASAIRCAGLLLMALALLTVTVIVPPPHRVLSAGLPAAVLVMAVLSASTLVRWPSLLVKLGDASYSLYLSHVFVLAALRAATAPLMKHEGHALLGWAFMLLAVTASIVAGHVLYRLIEAPTTRELNRLLRGAR